MRKLRIPSSHGHWSGTPGNSKWYPDADHTFNGGATGAQLKARYGLVYVTYNDFEPDFMPYADRTIGAIHLSSIPRSRQGTGGSYDRASKAAMQKLNLSSASLAKYMNEHRLTWHECGDGRTIIAIPTEINSAFPHTGAIGLKQSYIRLCKYMYINGYKHGKKYRRVQK